jgi:hypothetical protein
VFIDTSVFRAKQFNVEAEAFSSLGSLIEEGRARVYTTSVTRREIKHRISAAVKSARAAKKAFQKEAWIFRNLKKPEYEALFCKGSEAAEVLDVFGQVESYLSEVNATDIPLKHASPEKIFDDYFSHHAPFGEEKKKDEFPDAFVIDSIRKWCGQESQTMYIISGDGDMKDCCGEDGPLFHLPDVAAFVDLVIRQDEANSKFALRAFQEHEGQIKSAIEAAFRDAGFFLTDQTGEDVDIVSVDEIDLGYPDLLRADDDEAVVEILPMITFTAELSYEDPDSGIWDSEDKVMLFVQTKHETVERTLGVPAEIRLCYDVAAPSKVQVFCESVNNGEPVTFEADEPCDYK